MGKFFELARYLPWVLLLVGVVYCCLDELQYLFGRRRVGKMRYKVTLTWWIEAADEDEAIEKMRETDAAPYVSAEPE